MADAGQFTVHWRAHGLSYGIPVNTLDAVKDGQIVITNGSRAVLDAFRSAYPAVTVVSLTASREALEKRLKARGRETEAEIMDRLARADAHKVSGNDVITIDNSGPLEAAVDAFVTLIESLLNHRHAAE